jgi:hypothetical protein
MKPERLSSVFEILPFFKSLYKFAAFTLPLPLGNGRD